MQVVELDFLYPSEGVHRRWDSGYRITSTAATWDQTALVLSVPRRKPADETQETLRTSAFPSTHVKVNCAYVLSRSLILFAQQLCFVNLALWISVAGEMGQKSLYCICLLWSYCFLSWPTSTEVDQKK